jgi:hypothetical protein
MKTLLLLNLFSALIITGCAKLPDSAPPTSPCTVTINALESSGQRDHPCYKTANGPDYIDFDGSITVKFASRNRYENLNEVAFSSPATTNKFPVQVVIQVPNNNTPYKVEVYVKGRNCSRCASGFAAAGEADHPCNEQQTTTGYKVAYPTWAETATYVNYHSTFTYDYVRPAANVPNTCYTCTVPN